MYVHSLLTGDSVVLSTMFCADPLHDADFRIGCFSFRRRKVVPLQSIPFFPLKLVLMCVKMLTAQCGYLRYVLIRMYTGLIGCLACLKLSIVLICRREK